MMSTSARCFFGQNLRFQQGNGSSEKKTQRRICSAEFKHEKLKVVKKFVNKNFVALVLSGGMAFGLLLPGPGQGAHQLGLSKWAPGCIFLLSGLALQNGDFVEATEAWPAGILGLASILLISPMASSLILRINSKPKELVVGLAIFSCAPTTLSTAVTLAQIAGANKALALALTVGSNLLGMLTIPFMIAKFIGPGLGVSIPVGKLLASLVQTLLLPLLIGKFAREKISGVAQWIDSNRNLVSVLSSICLSMVPWMQVSCSRSMLLQVDGRCLASCVVLGILLHVVLLVWNTLLVRLVTGDERTKRAFILAASQKTLPVSVAIVEKLGSELGERGLLVLPCVAAHFMQVFIDSILVNYWIQKDVLDTKSI